MWRSNNYEFNQESHSLHENSSSWSTTYPSYEHYYVPPQTIQKRVYNHPSFNYESSDDDNDDNYHYDDWAAANNSRPLINHDHGHGNGGNWYGSHHANAKNKHHGNILRPPTHQYRYPNGINHQGNNQASRVKTNNQNHAMEEDYPRKYFPNYGEVSRLEDKYDNNEGIVGEELEYPFMKGMLGGNKVKRIEVIEYERKTYKGARQEWVVLGGSGATNRPNYHVPRVKGF